MEKKTSPGRIYFSFATNAIGRVSICSVRRMIFFLPRHGIHCTPRTRFIIFPEKISNVHRSKMYAHRHMYTAAHMWPIFLKFSAFVSVCVSPFFSSSMTSAAIFSFSNQKEHCAHSNTRRYNLNSKCVCIASEAEEERRN